MVWGMGRVLPWVPGTGRSKRICNHQRSSNSVRGQSIHTQGGRGRRRLPGGCGGARRRSPPLAQAVPLVLLPFRLSLLLIEHRCRSLELRLHPSARISFPSALKSGAFDWIRDWLRSPLLICGAAAPSSEAVAPRGLSRGPGRMRSCLRPKSHERKTRRDLRPWGCSRGQRRESQPSCNRPGIDGTMLEEETTQRRQGEEALRRGAAAPCLL